MRYYAALLPLMGFSEESYGIWSDVTGFHLRFLEAAAGAPADANHRAGAGHIGFTAPDHHFLEEIRDTMVAAGFAVAEVQPLNGRSLLLAGPAGPGTRIPPSAPAPGGGR